MSTELTFKERFAAVRAELKAPKNRMNKFGGYKYRNTEDILQGLKPLLKKYKLILLLSDSIVVRGDGEQQRFYVEATARIMDALSDDSIFNTAYAREAEEKKGMDESQITGTASSYARKYALNGLFNIDDAIDADNDEAMEALDDLGAKIKCERCGENIRPYNDGKRGYTPVQIARLSQMRFGKDYCMMCAKSVSAEEELVKSGQMSKEQVEEMNAKYNAKGEHRKGNK